VSLVSSQYIYYSNLSEVDVNRIDAQGYSDIPPCRTNIDLTIYSTLSSRQRLGFFLHLPVIFSTSHTQCDLTSSRNKRFVVYFNFPQIDVF
jgi:hypothetical protein